MCWKEKTDVFDDQKKILIKISFTSFQSNRNNEPSLASEDVKMS